MNFLQAAVRYLGVGVGFYRPKPDAPIGLFSELVNSGEWGRTSCYFRLWSGSAREHAHTHDLLRRLVCVAHRLE